MEPGVWESAGPQFAIAQAVKPEECPRGSSEAADVGIHGMHDAKVATPLSVGSDNQEILSSSICRRLATSGGFRHRYVSPGTHQRGKTTADRLEQ